MSKRKAIDYGVAWSNGAQGAKSNLPCYDEEFEWKAAEEAVASASSGTGTSSSAFGSLSGNGISGELLRFATDSGIPVHSYPFDPDFEWEAAKNAVATARETGYFYDCRWKFAGVAEVVLAPERPIFLYTQMANDEPGTVCGMAHNHHPFVAMVHLLKEADIGSTVFVSMPYFTDIYVVDEFVHFAQPENQGGRGLQIKVIIGETQDNLKYLNYYLKNDELPHSQRAIIFDAMKRVHYRSAKTTPGFCHSIAMVSNAGCMIGSYNYTTAARMYNEEHNTLFGPNEPMNTQVRDQLEARWNRSAPLVYYGSPHPIKSTDG